MSSRTARASLAAFCIGLIVIAMLNGAAEPLLTPFWPTIQRSVGIGDALMGIAISGIAIGLALGTSARRFGQAKLGWRVALAASALVFWPCLALVPLAGVCVVGTDGRQRRLGHRQRRSGRDLGRAGVAL